MPHVRRRELLAYLIAAGVAGTMLVFPYVMRDAALRYFLPGRDVPLVPFFLLPVLWGVWNVLWVRWRPPVAIGTWGAIVALVAAAGVNAYLWWGGDWFAAAAAVFVFLPVAYYLLWHLVVGPLNEALGVER